MNKNNQGIWNCDMHGKVRSKIGGYVSCEKQNTNQIYFNKRRVRDALVLFVPCLKTFQETKF